MLKIEIPYHDDGTHYYEGIRHLKWPVFLDSAFQSEREHSALARFDIITANPFTTIISNDGVISIEGKDAGSSNYKGNPLELLQLLMEKYKCYIFSESP